MLPATDCRKRVSDQVHTRMAYIVIADVVIAYAVIIYAVMTDVVMAL